MVCCPPGEPLRTIAAYDLISRMISARNRLVSAEGQGLGAEMIHDLRVMADVLAFIQAEGADEILGVP